MSVAKQLQIPVRELLDENVRFSAIEAAEHTLGRAVTQIMTERLALARAERMTGPQPCPTCGRAERGLHNSSQAILAGSDRVPARTAKSSRRGQPKSMLPQLAAVC